MSSSRHFEDWLLKYTAEDVCFQGERYPDVSIQVSCVSLHEPRRNFISYERALGTVSIIRIPPTYIEFRIDIKYLYIDIKLFYRFMAFTKCWREKSGFGVVFRRCPVWISDGTQTILTQFPWFSSVSPGIFRNNTFFYSKYSFRFIIHWLTQHWTLCSFNYSKRR